MPLMYLTDKDNERVDRFLDLFEKGVNYLMTSGPPRSPGPYCCSCGTHAVWDKDGLTCPNCDFYDGEKEDKNEETPV